MSKHTFETSAGATYPWADVRLIMPWKSEERRINAMGKDDKMLMLDNRLGRSEKEREEAHSLWKKRFEEYQAMIARERNEAIAKEFAKTKM